MRKKDEQSAVAAEPAVKDEATTTGTVRVALETVLLDEETADALCYAKDGTIYEDRRKVAAAARESVQGLVSAALEEPLERAVTNLRDHRRALAIAAAQQRLDEAKRELDALQLPVAVATTAGAEAAS